MNHYCLFLNTTLCRYYLLILGALICLSFILSDATLNQEPLMDFPPISNITKINESKKYNTLVEPSVSFSKQIIRPLSLSVNSNRLNSIVSATSKETKFQGNQGVNSNFGAALTQEASLNTNKLPHIRKVSCNEAFKLLKLQRHVWNSPTVSAFRLMQAAVTGTLLQNNPEVNIDKTVKRALHLIASHFRRSVPSISWPKFILLLGDCVMDKTECTLLMHFVKLGLTETLQYPLAFHLTGQDQLSSLRDANQNNLIHLSILSNNVQVVNLVLSAIQAKEKNGVLELLDARNSQGDTPRTLAIKAHRKDIILSLQAHYSVYKILSLVGDNIPFIENEQSTHPPLSQNTTIHRESCYNVFEKIKQNVRAWNSPTVSAFRVIGFAVIGGLDKFNFEVDKIIVKALTVIGTHFSRTGPTILWSDFVQLFGGCAANSKSQTYLMRIIEMGFTESLKMPLAFSLKGREGLADLIDSNYNNLIHLAVMSRNVDIVNQVISAIQSYEKNSLLQLMDAKNSNGQTSREIALNSHRGDIITSLHSHYSVYKILSHIGDKIPSTEDINLAADDNAQLANMQHRPLCSTLFENIKRNRVIWDSPTVSGFRVIGFAVTGGLDTFEVEIDKIVSKALFVIGLHFSRLGKTISWNHFIQLLGGCSANANNQTYLMRFIELGLSETLRIPLVFSMQGKERLIDLRDKNQNNLIHLAVKSRNVEIVHQVLDGIQGKPDEILHLLESRNSDNLTPRLLAISIYRNDIVIALQAHYATYSSLKDSTDGFSNSLVVGTNET